MHPTLIKTVEEAIKLTKQDFSVTDGVRTTRQQKVLFDKGASQRDGTKRKSLHQKQDDGYGHAVDLVPYVSGLGVRWEWSLIYPIAAAMAIAARNNGLELVWGGVWDCNLSEYSRGITDIDKLALAMKSEVQNYIVRHPGPDFIDGPHYELAD